jgi:hypothetical protein
VPYIGCSGMAVGSKSAEDVTALPALLESAVLQA